MTPEHHPKPGAPTPSSTVPLAAWLLLALTAALALLWSQQKLLDQDEFLSFYTDSVPTLSAVLGVQLHSPISLDPPTYHLLSHLAMNAFGSTPEALRLPSLLGFLLMELALYLLVRKLASQRAALLATALPLATASFRYAVEGRPYGLLLGLYALALLCWYTAARHRDNTTPNSRLLPLIGLTLAIIAAITSHYFGILILLPVCCGELARTVERRHLDSPMLAAIAAGCAGILLILPFKAALAP